MSKKKKRKWYESAKLGKGAVKVYEKLEEEAVKRLKETKR